MKAITIGLLLTAGLGSLTVVSGALATLGCLLIAAYGLRIAVRW